MLLLKVLLLVSRASILRSHITSSHSPVTSSSLYVLSTMPHGRVVLFPTITLTIASIFSVIVLCNCQVVETAIVGRVENYNNLYPYSFKDSAGFWVGCVYYYPSSTNMPESTTFQDDRAHKAAMSIGLFACMVGVTAMISLWPITCRPYNEIWISIIGGGVWFSFVAQLATLSMLGTQHCQAYGCRLGWAGIVSIVAAVLWFISAIGVFMIPKFVETSTTTRQATGETITLPRRLPSPMEPRL